MWARATAFIMPDMGKPWSSSCVAGTKAPVRRHRAGERVLVGLETKTDMKRASKASVSHHGQEIEELRADRELAVEYLKAAMRELEDPDNRAAGLLALRTIAEAYGGLGVIAVQAGISREALYRSLSPKGNPTLKTLLAVLKAVGMRLSVEPEKPACV